MNNNLQKLAEQSGILFEPKKQYRVHFVRTETLDTFAQLIIKECAQVVETKKDYAVGCGYVTLTDSERIKKHFGIIE